MNGHLSFKSLPFDYSIPSSKPSPKFYRDATQQVKNIISDILLTLDEQDKSTFNINSLLKPHVKRVNTINKTKRRFSAVAAHIQQQTPSQTYLCTNNKAFFQQIENIIKEEEQTVNNDNTPLQKTITTFNVDNDDDNAQTERNVDTPLSPVNQHKHKQHHHNRQRHQRLSLILSRNNISNHVLPPAIVNAKSIKHNNVLMYDVEVPTFKSSIIKRKKHSMVFKQHSSSDDNNSDDNNTNNNGNNSSNIIHRPRPKKSQSNLQHLRRESKVLNIEKQIRESFNLQQTQNHHLRKDFTQRFSIHIVPHGIEKEYDNIITESNYDINNYQTMCSELRLSAMHGIKPTAPQQQSNHIHSSHNLKHKKSDNTIHKFNIQPQDNINNNNKECMCSSNDIIKTFPSNKTCKSLLTHQHQQHELKSPLSSSSSRSSTTFLITKQDNISSSPSPKHHQTNMTKVNTTVNNNNNNTHTNDINIHRRLNKNTYTIYDSLSDQELDYDQHLQHITESFYITPTSPLRKALDSSVAIFALLFLFITPIEIAYIHTWHKSFIYFSSLYILGELTFLLDFILSFFMAYIDIHDNLITTKHKILHYYKTSWLSIDLLTALPINTIINIITILQHHNISLFTSTNSHLRFIHLLKLIKLIKLIKLCINNNFLIQSIINTVLYSSKGKRLLLYITLITFITVLHILTCLFVFFGYSHYPNWILTQQLQPTHYIEVYVAGLYFVVLTILSVGYGDIVGSNHMEKVYVVFLLIISVFVYSWLVSTLSKIKDADAVLAVSEGAAHVKAKFTVLEHIRHHYPNMTYACYKRIIRYLKYNYKKQLFNPKMIFENLPSHLQRDLVFHMYKPEVENFVFFKPFDNDDFIMKVFMCFQQNICIKNERIVSKGDYMDEMLFVRNGKLAIELSIPADLTHHVFDVNDAMFTQYVNALAVNGSVQYVKLIEIRKNEHYGDIVMLLNKRSPLDVRVCTRRTELFYLKKADVIDIAVAFPHIWRKVMERSMVNMKQISVLIKQKLNYYYVNNKNVIGKLISQNESYFEHMHVGMSGVSGVGGSGKKVMNDITNNSNNVNIKRIEYSEIGITSSDEQLISHEEHKGNSKLININNNNNVYVNRTQTSSLTPPPLSSSSSLTSNNTPRSNISSIISSLSINSTPTHKSHHDINKELHNGESLITNHLQPLPSSSSNDDDDESNYTSSSPRQTATSLLSDSKLPTKFSHSIQPNNTHKIINEFHRNPTPIYTKHLNNINTQSTGHHRKRTASSSLNVKQRSKAYNGTVVKAKHKLNLLYNSNTNTTNSVHSNNNIYLTQFDWMLNGNKNSIHSLSKLRVTNKRSALNNNMNALKLEQIQTNIQQNQLNLKQPHVFYSEAFKEMIHSKERNKVP